VSHDSISGDDVKRELQALLSDSSASVRLMDELQSALGWAEIYYSRATRKNWSSPQAVRGYLLSAIYKAQDAAE